MNPGSVILYVRKEGDADWQPQSAVPISLERLPCLGEHVATDGDPDRWWEVEIVVHQTAGGPADALLCRIGRRAVAVMNALLSGSSTRRAGDPDQPADL